MGLKDSFPWLEGVEDWAENKIEILSPALDWRKERHQKDMAYLQSVADPLIAASQFPLKEQVYGLGEAGLEIGSQMGNMAVVGLGGLATAPTFGMQDTSKAITNRLTDNPIIPQYKAKSDAGRLYMDAAQAAEAPIEAFSADAGDTLFETSESLGLPREVSAGLGALGMAGPEVLADVVIGKGISTMLPDGKQYTVGDINASGPSRSQRGSLKIDESYTDMEDGERFTSRSEDYGTPNSDPETKIMGAPSVETRDADFKQSEILDRDRDLPLSRQNDGMMFGSTIPDALRFTDKNSGNAQSWKNAFAKQGVFGDEIKMFMPGLANADSWKEFTRDEIFDMYESYGGERDIYVRKQSVENIYEPTSYSKVEAQAKDARAKYNSYVQEGKALEELIHENYLSDEQIKEEFSDTSAYNVARAIEENRGLYGIETLARQRISREKQLLAERTDLALSDPSIFTPASKKYVDELYNVTYGDNGLDMDRPGRAEPRDTLLKMGVPESNIRALYEAQKKKDMFGGKFDALRTVRDGMRKETAGNTRLSYTDDYKMPGGIDHEILLFNQRVDEDQPKGDSHHGSHHATFSTDARREGGKVAALAHARTERRPVYGELFFNPETRKKEWSEVGLFGGYNTDGRRRPATQNITEVQSDTWQKNKVPFRERLTEAEDAALTVNEERTGEIPHDIRAQKEMLSVLKEKDGAVLDIATVIPDGPLGESMTNAAGRAYDETYKQKTKTHDAHGNIQSYKYDNKIEASIAGLKAALKEVQQFKGALPIENAIKEGISRAIPKLKHEAKLIELEQEKVRLQAEHKKLTAPLISSRPDSLSLESNPERLKFVLTERIREAVNIGDEYVSLSSMRAQGEVYAKLYLDSGQKFPKESTAPGTEGDPTTIYYSERHQEFVDADGNVFDSAELGLTNDEREMRENEHHIDEYEYFEEAQENYVPNEAKRLVKEELFEEIEEWFADGDGPFDTREEAEDFVKATYEETKPEPPFEKNELQMELDDGQMAGELQEAMEEYDFELENWTEEMNEALGEVYESRFYSDPDSNITPVDDTEFDSLQEAAEDYVRRSLETDMEYGEGFYDDPRFFDESQTAAEELTWDEYVAENGFKKEGEGKQEFPGDSVELADPDVGIDTYTTDEVLTWGGGKKLPGMQRGAMDMTEVMANTNYHPKIAEGVMRRALRDLGLTPAETYEAMGRINVSVSERHGWGRQQNVPAIKITKAIKDAVENNGPGFFQSRRNRNEEGRQKEMPTDKRKSRVYEAMLQSQREMAAAKSWKDKNIKP